MWPPGKIIRVRTLHVSSKNSPGFTKTWNECVKTDMKAWVVQPVAASICGVRQAQAAGGVCVRTKAWGSKAYINLDREMQNSYVRNSRLERALPSGSVPKNQAQPV